MRYKRLIDEGSLWIMVAAPTVWAAHFLLSYWLAAVWCAKAVETGGPLDTVRLWVVVFTVVALALVGWLAWIARRDYQGRLRIDDQLTGDSDAERMRFLGHATLLLCSLSAIAILIDTLPALVFTRCF